MAVPGSHTHARSFVQYCRGVQRDVRALRAKALAEDVQAPLGLLMPRRSHASTTANARCGWLCLANRVLEYLV